DTAVPDGLPTRTPDAGAGLGLGGDVVVASDIGAALAGLGFGCDVVGAADIVAALVGLLDAPTATGAGAMGAAADDCVQIRHPTGVPAAISIPKVSVEPQCGQASCVLGAAMCVVPLERNDVHSTLLLYHELGTICHKQVAIFFTRSRWTTPQIGP